MNLASYQPSRALNLEMAATFMENLWASLRKIEVMYSLQVCCGFVDLSGHLGPRPLACWIAFESRRGHGYFFSCVLSGMSLVRADHSSRGILSNVVCLNVILKPR